MITFSKDVRLRTGEVVEGAVVRAPDLAWADRLEAMLRHKGEPWNWQNSEILRRETGLEARFYVLHRQGRPFANIMIVETNGVGMLGHVWTEPPDRGCGASSALMDMALVDFRALGSRALYLGTDFDSPPWNYYRRRGFKAVEEGSGYMELRCQPSIDFEASWFGAQEARINPLDWPDWPAAAPLFLGPWPGVVRIASVQLIGRRSPEEPMLSLLREEQRRHQLGEQSCARVLRASTSAAVLGFASWRQDPVWRDAVTVDLYCHPSWWHRADELLKELPLPPFKRMIAYADADLIPKRKAFERAGFVPIGKLPKWVTKDVARQSLADVEVYVWP